jgi:hypothetical protein
MLNSTPPPVHVVRESNGHRQHVPRLLSIENPVKRGSVRSMAAFLLQPAGLFVLGSRTGVLSRDGMARRVPPRDAHYDVAAIVFDADKLKALTWLQLPCLCELTPALR